MHLGLFLTILVSINMKPKKNNQAGFTPHLKTEFKNAKGSRSLSAGFTLVEMLFYIVFITIILGATFGIVQNLLSNAEALKTGISVEEEGNFILKKLSWVINDVGTVNYPALNSTGAFLSVNKNDLSPGSSPVVVDSAGGIMRIERGGNGPKQLSNDRFVVSNLSFERTWDGSNPESELISISFELNSRSFELTRKIR